MFKKFLNLKKKIFILFLVFILGFSSVSVFGSSIEKDNYKIYNIILPYYKLVNSDNFSTHFFTLPWWFSPGTWFIPGVGKVVMLTTGIVTTGVAVVQVGSWAWNQIDIHFARGGNSNNTPNVPQKLKNNQGNVDLGRFNQRGNDGDKKDSKTGWRISPDTSNHGGSRWKLLNPRGERVASLDGAGRILRH